MGQAPIMPRATPPQHRGRPRKVGGQAGVLGRAVSWLSGWQLEPDGQGHSCEAIGLWKVSSIKKTKSGKWQARWRSPEGSSHRKTFAKKTQAEQHLTDIDHKKLTGAYVDPKAGAITFREYAEEWREMQQHRPSTREQVEINLRLHAYPAFGHRHLNKVRPSELQAWVKGLEAKLAPSTIEVVARYVVSVFRAAVSDRLIVNSPADGLKLPKKTKKEVVPLRVEQVRAIAESIQPRYSAMVLFMAGSGLRPAEAMGLSEDRVVWLRKTLRVDRQMVTVEGVADFGPPKTAASYRTIPLPEFLVHTMSEHVRTFEPRDDGLLFTDANGAALRRNRFREVWKQAMKHLDFECNGPHQLRHHYASLLIQHGESVKVVQSRLGHASASETLDTYYSHLWPDSEDSTRAAVESAYEVGGSVSASVLL